MAQSLTDLSILNQIDEDIDNGDVFEFNDQPIVRNNTYDDCTLPAPKTASDRPLSASALRELGIRVNSRRKATLHAPIQGLASAYLDQDTSGTYDPKCERATPPDSPQRKSRKQSSSRTTGESNAPKSVRIPKGYKEGLFLVFKFGKEENLRYLRTIPFDLGTCRSNTVDSEPLHLLTSASGCVNASYPRRVRCRRSKIPNLQTRNDGLTIDQLTKENPQRRGCKSCFEQGNDYCSLIEDAFQYPCEACDDASTDCELIVPPEFKKTCQRCKRKRLNCSFRSDGGKGVSSCNACAEAGTKCCAGPLKSFKVQRSRNNSDYRRAPSTSRSSHPDQSGSSLSPGKKTETLVLEFNGRKNVKPFYTGKQLQSLRTLVLQLIEECLGTPSKLITTAFCHPIQFNYVPDPMSKFPCSWCASPVFGLWGHGTLENVEVIPGEGARGHEEISNGHGKRKETNSRMCVRCTYQRISPMACRKHDIRKMNAGLVDLTAVEASLERICSGKENQEELARTIKWCSICVALAEFSCCSINKLSRDSEPGCGLHLCLACADIGQRLLRSTGSQQHRLFLDQLIRVWKDEAWKRDGGELRADAQFLESTGELRVRWDHNMGICKEEDAGPAAKEKLDVLAGRCSGEEKLTKDGRKEGSGKERATN